MAITVDDVGEAEKLKAPTGQTKAQPVLLETCRSLGTASRARTKHLAPRKYVGGRRLVFKSHPHIPSQLTYVLHSSSSRLAFLVAKYVSIPSTGGQPILSSSFFMLLMSTTSTTASGPMLRLPWVRLRSSGGSGLSVAVET